MKSMFTRVCTLLSMFGLFGIASAQVFTGTCSLPETTYVASPGATTSAVSTTYVDVPDMLVFFDVAAGECVTIEFSLAVSAPSTKGLFIRAVFDENPDLIMLPQQVQIQTVPDSTSKGIYESVSFVLAVENGLGPGGHNVTIQWKGENAATVRSSKRTLIVRHN